MRQGYTLVPAVIVILAIAAFIGVFAYALWPKAEELKPTVTVRHKTVKNTNVANTNGVSNVNNANTNTVATNTNTNTDQTAEWKTYHSKQFNLSFKYPPDWTVQEGELNSPYRVTVSAPGKSPSYVTFWLDHGYDGLSVPYGATTKKTSIALAGRSATRSETQTSDGKLFFDNINFKTVPIGWGAYSTISVQPAANGSVVVTDDILDTLKISDPVAGSSWKTYTNTTYSYSVKYPPEYTPSEVNFNSSNTNENVDSGIAQEYQFQKGLLAGDNTYRVLVYVFTRNDPEGLYAWAKNGFPKNAAIAQSHNNPHKVTFDGKTFVMTDGDGGSTGIPEYFIFHNNTLFELTDFQVGSITGSSNAAIIGSLEFSK